jgi:hypothetical protein
MELDSKMKLKINIMKKSILLEIAIYISMEWDNVYILFLIFFVRMVFALILICIKLKIPNLIIVR